MEKQLISPEQMNSLHRDTYYTINLDRIGKTTTQGLASSSGAPVGNGGTSTTVNPNIDNLMKKMNESNQILQSNVNYLKDKLDVISPTQSIQKEEQIQQIKWNRYITKKYSYQGRIMAILIFVCFLFILLHGIAPSIFPWASGILLSIAFVYVGYLLWDLMYRDPLNFDEYTFYNYKGKHMPAPSGSSTDLNFNLDASNCLIKNMEKHYTKL
jgi:hypothetical protein